MTSVDQDGRTREFQSSLRSVDRRSREFDEIGLSRHFSRKKRVDATVVGCLENKIRPFETVFGPREGEISRESEKKTSNAQRETYCPLELTMGEPFCGMCNWSMHVVEHKNSRHFV